MLVADRIDDALWDELAEIIATYDPCDIDHPAHVDRGGPRRTDSRLVLEGILYHEETGCAWMRLPRRYAHYSIVYRRWCWWTEIGVLDRLYSALNAHGVEVP